MRVLAPLNDCSRYSLDPPEMVSGISPTNPVVWLVGRASDGYIHGGNAVNSRTFGNLVPRTKKTV